jgi:hypothetical protein
MEDVVRLERGLKGGFTYAGVCVCLFSAAVCVAGAAVVKRMQVAARAAALLHLLLLVRLPRFF